MEIKRIFVGKLHTNCYIISEGNCACVIDPGAEPEKIMEYAQGKKVDKIILTHGHFDHIGAVAAIKKLTGAKVYISRADEIMLKDAKKNLFADFNGGAEGFEPSYCDDYLEGTIDICGHEFEVIDTPGHSDGSVCLYYKDELISGDTLFCESIGRYDHGNYDKLMQSLWKLMLLDDTVKVHPGHGFSTTIGHERTENPYLR